jgi:hypothetical protein
MKLRSIKRIHDRGTTAARAAVWSVTAKHINRLHSMWLNNLRRAYG